MADQEAMDVDAGRSPAAEPAGPPAEPEPASDPVKLEGDRDPTPEAGAQAPSTGPEAPEDGSEALNGLNGAPTAGSSSLSPATSQHLTTGDVSISVSRRSSAADDVPPEPERRSKSASASEPQVVTRVASVKKDSAPPMEDLPPSVGSAGRKPTFLEDLEQRARAEHNLPPISGHSDAMEVDTDQREGPSSMVVAAPVPDLEGEGDGEEEGSGAEEGDESGDEDESGSSEESGDEDEGETAGDEESRGATKVDDQADGDTTMGDGPATPAKVGDDAAVAAADKSSVGQGPDADDDDDKATTEGEDDDADRPKPKKPMPTIRLSLALGPTGHVVERSVLLMAKEAGYDLPEDTAITHGASLLPEAEPEAVPAMDADNPDAPPPKRRRRRRIQERDEGYDASDPFVDDSEIQTTEPKFYHAPEKDGFYVAQGPLKLKQARRGRGRKLGSKNKPKIGEANGMAPTVNGAPPMPAIDPFAGPSMPRLSVPITTPVGTRTEPITLDDDESSHAAAPSFGGTDVTTLSNTFVEGGMTDKEAEREHRRKEIAKLLRIPLVKDKSEPLHPQLMEAIADLEKEVRSAEFPPKKFPQHLKPLTVAVAQLALDLQDYDETRFFPKLAEIFPYNTFTIKKLVKKEILPARKEYYATCMEDRLRQLSALIQEQAPIMVSEYQKAYADYLEQRAGWEARQTNKENDGGTPSAPSFGGPSVGDLDNASAAGDGGDGGDKPPKEPAKAFRFSPQMKEVYYECIKLDEELTAVIIDTQKIAEKEATHSALEARKQLYARMISLFPEGYITSHKLSREMTAVKKKFEG